MSNPPNPLQSFRSYSYHHIMVLVTTTAVAETLSNSINLDDFTHPTNKYEPKSTGGGSYVILLNTMTDAQYILKHLEISHAVITQDSTTANTMNNLSPTMDGAFELVEVGGVRFMNVLANAHRSLGVYPTGSLYLMKTIFYGYDDSNQISSVINLKPFLFTIKDMSVLFDHSGATYSAKLTGIMNGVASSPMYSLQGSTVSLGVSTGTTFKDGIKKLEGLINETVTKNTQKYLEELKATNANVSSDTGKKLRYVFNVDEKYQSSEYKIADNSLKLNGNNPNDAVLTFGDNSSIDIILSKCIQSCSQILLDSQGSPPRVASVQSNLEITDKEYVITYYIHSTMTGDYKPCDPNAPILAAQQANKDGGNQPNVIEFDYIFTAKNTDIIEFDLKLNSVIALLANLTSGESAPTPESISKSTNNITNSMGDTNVLVSTCDDPNHRTNNVRIPPVLVANDSMRHKTDPVSTVNYNSMLAKFAGTESTNIKMVITGNPRLMNDMMPMPSDFENGTKTNNAIFTNPYKVPGLVKVNIRMPIYTETNISGGGTAWSLENTEPFWYDGTYMIMEVKSMFTDGFFTQELLLTSSPKDIGVKTSNKPATPRAAPPGAPSKNVYQMDKLTAGQKSDARTAAVNQNDPGFKSRAEFVKAIWPAAQKAGAALGVDPKYLVAQVCNETGWGKSVGRNADGSTSHNLFNIKADRSWHGPTAINPRVTSESNVFRSYSSYDESFDDYVAFIKRNPRYSHALNAAANGDSRGYVQQMSTAGYGGNSGYAGLIFGVADGRTLNGIIKSIG